MVAIPDLYEMFFEVVLQLPRCTGSEGWGCWAGPENFAHDFIYALFLPHVVLLIFLFIFSDTLSMRTKHKGLGVMLSVAAYVYIIYAGWYSIIATFLTFWLVLSIGLGLITFVVSRIFPPVKTRARMGLGEEVAKALKGSKSKEKKIEKIDAYISAFEELRDEAEQGGDDETRDYYQNKINRLKAKKKVLEKGGD